MVLYCQISESGELVGFPKVKFVARGYQQVQGVVYTYAFSLVVKFPSIRILLASDAHYDLKLPQMDVVTVFLNGDSLEEVSIKVPEGIVVSNKTDVFCNSNKALYGSKQAPE